MSHYKIRLYLIYVLFVLVFACGVPDAVAADAIGVVKRLKDTVNIQRGEKALWPSVGGFIYSGDVLSTEEGSKVHITFRDQSEIILGEDSEAVIERYVYDDPSGAKNGLRISFIKGGFSYTSGKIAEESREAVGLQTPFGNISLRGTKLWGGIFEEECQIFVEEGAIDVSNQHGFVAVEAGQGVDILDKSDAPLPAEAWMAEDVKWIKRLVTF